MFSSGLRVCLAGAMGRNHRGVDCFRFNIQKDILTNSSNHQIMGCSESGHVPTVGGNPHETDRSRMLQAESNRRRMPSVSLPFPEFCDDINRIDNGLLELGKTVQFTFLILYRRKPRWIGRE